MSEVTGSLHERVTLSTLARTEDGSGGYTQAPVALDPADVYADVESLRGEERLQALALDVTVTHKVRLRYHQAVNAQTRITWGTRVLEVIGPPVELIRRHLLECYCAERVVE